MIADEARAAPGHDQEVERLAREAEGLRFLLEVTSVLSSTFEFGECLRRLASLAVPVLGDLCLIDVVVDGSIVRMAGAHADPVHKAAVEELVEHFAPDPAGAHPAARVIRSGRSEIGQSMNEGSLRNITRDDRHLHLIRSLEFGSYVCAPLIARGRILGSITLLAGRSGRVLGADDLALTEELASRAALVVDNSRLFAERAEVARALQEALLPPRLPKVPGLELAARYRAAGVASQVGGDFYDVFDIGRGSWVVTIGDVCGKGPEAAAVTGLVRHALHASALSNRDPAALLGVADAVFCEAMAEKTERFCTAACAIVRPGPETHLRLASAGHPPVLALRADGSFEELYCSGTALGLGLGHLAQRRCVLNPGDAVIFYTDGLTEARDTKGELFGERRLADTLATCRGVS